MRKSILLAKANLRRAKGQVAAIIGLMLFASLMLNLWLIFWEFPKNCIFLIYL